MIDMDKVIDFEGRRYPFAGTTPQVGEVVAGFIVRRVTEHVVYVGLEQTEAEERAVERWWGERIKR